MYSERLKRILREKRIEEGDYIRIFKKGNVYEGILMPKSELSDKNTIILKLNNGYNVGISDFDRIELIERKKRKKSIRRERIDFKGEEITLIFTGGTVASKVDYETGGVKGLMNSEELLEFVPEIGKVKAISPFVKMSEDISFEDWQKIGRICYKELNGKSEGIIITHGTDFMHYTSSALSFMLRDLNKPVILTGSQRSSDRGSSDARMNLICSGYLARSNIAEVGICMHGSINDDYNILIRGTRARKMHSSRRDAFRPINDFPIARIYPNGKIEILNEFRERNDGKVKLVDKFEEKVALIKIHPNLNPEIIDFFMERGYRGIVLETSGLGHVPTNARKSLIENLKNAVENGIVVCSTTQCIYGRINPYVYSNLRKLYLKIGIIPLEDMLSETAYVKLMWVLGNFRNNFREMMLKNFAGELNYRSLNNFLY